MNFNLERGNRTKFFPQMDNPLCGNRVPAALSAASHTVLNTLVKFCVYSSNFLNANLILKAASTLGAGIERGTVLRLSPTLDLENERRVGYLNR